MNAVRIGKENADLVLRYLFSIKAVVKELKINKRNKWIEIPLLRPLKKMETLNVKRLGGRLVFNLDFKQRNIPLVPYSVIKNEIQEFLPKILIEQLPHKWELFGNVLILKMPEKFKQYETNIAKIYANHLKAHTVLLDTAGIAGTYREPQVRFLMGNNAEITHVENHIKFKFDASKIMFASGNIDERKRMAVISNNTETIVDMFAGIGYFSVPLAVYSKPRLIYSCEINTVAYKYLLENIRLNHVNNIIKPLLGDCRDTAPENTADRILMGYLDSADFLQKAMDMLKNRGGFIHYHEACPLDMYNRPLKRLKTAAKRAGRDIKIKRFKVVKSYAPCIDHVVVDSFIGPKK